ncbi:bifunctional transcriptional activator/DNA repair enzyme AdaA [Oceanobacillus chungangensis]|uniref:AraC family transcriptional regulator n=1 Tax=Oceanobacillus chungangensis TaxID=1229152 RepID=A0A3D8PJW5_9BACI|nr:bifunctional transcriptional activator/DNA repair enzyme AdaA [Oceanobacillus chungangensis]RDW15518.1 AraC family transcriptional regulator [Oceanobacillus chungangensis]
MKNHPATDKQWEAINENDKSYDNQFFYAVKTTKIFCKPSCKSRVPNYDNVSVFYHAEDALHGGYRPCKRCKSADYRLPGEEWVLHAKTYMEEKYSSYLTLNVIAAGCHGSPFHLHRVFKSITGITPLDYLHEIRMKKAIGYLQQTNKPIGEIAALIGIPNAAYFSVSFKKWRGETPREYRKKRGKGADR